MIIKKGKIEHSENYSDTIAVTTIATIIEKTEGNYVEILFCKDSKEMRDNGNLTQCEYNNSFTVYHGKTINQILSLNDISNGYTWTEPLTEIS